MPSRHIHLKFDKLLVKHKIVRVQTDFDTVHNWMDSTRGSRHQDIDKRHWVENIRRDLKEGKPLEESKGKSIIERMRIYFRNRRLDSRTKNEYLRVAVAHELVDLLWKAHKDKYGRYPANMNISKFLDKCLKELKVDDLDHVRIR